MSENKPERQYVFDNIRALLIFLVVFGHVLELIINENWVSVVYAFIYAFHMPLFVFCSGYFAKTNPKRALVVLGVYAIFQVLYNLFSVYALEQTSNLQFTTPYWILWYIFAFVIWLSLTPFLEAFLDAQKKIVSFIFILSCVALGVLAGFDDNISYYLSLSRVLYFFPFFVLGFYARKTEVLNDLRRFSIRLSFGIFAFIIFAAFYFFIDLIDSRWFYGAFSYQILDGYNIIIRLGTYCAALILGVFILSITPSIRTPFSYIGQRTLQIFLLHGFIILLMRRFEIAGLIPSGFVLALFALGVSVIIVFALSFGLFSPRVLYNYFFSAKK